jgi:hypothetical protein
LEKSYDKGQRMRVGGKRRGQQRRQRKHIEGSNVSKEDTRIRMMRERDISSVL